MAEFINNVKNKNYNFNYTTRDNNIICKNQSNNNLKNDEIELTSANTNRKKHIVLAVIGAGIIAFFSRKKIVEFFAQIFKKSKKTNNGGNISNDYPNRRPPRTPQREIVGADNPPPPPPSGGATIKSPKINETLPLEKMTPEDIQKEYFKIRQHFWDTRYKANPELVKRQSELEKEMITKNISFIEKEKFPTNGSEDERLKYFHNKIWDYMMYNEASALDGLELFEKYGVLTKYDDYYHKKYPYIQPTIFKLSHCACTRLSRSAAIPSSVINKYMDVFFKFTKKDFDREEFNYFLEYVFEVAYSLAKTTIDEPTALRIINKLKENAQYLDKRHDLKEFNFDILDKTQRNPKVKKAVEELYSMVPRDRVNRGK